MTSRSDMAQIPVFHGNVTADGLLELSVQEQPVRLNYLKRLAGKPVDIVIKVHRSQRSLDQNAWHWGIALPIIADALGYDRDEHDELHYWLVKECFGTHLDPRMGEHVPNVRSSKLTTTQFSEFMEWQVRWAAKQGIVVPLPGEVAA